MALATLLLPSSSASPAAAAAGDHSGSRRHDHHHGSKRKKKPPPPSPQPSISSAPRTPSGARSQRGASSSSKKSPKGAAAAAAKNRQAQYQHHHRAQPATKKAAAAASSSSSSWEQVKSLLSCRSATAAARVHDPAAPSALARLRGGGAGACGASLCAMRDVVDAASSAASSAAADRDTAPLNRRRAHRAGGSSSSSAGGGSGSSHHSSLRGLSGCYECRAINVEPMSRRYPRPRELCACPQCGEVFTKADSLEHHQAIRHAVSELGPEDSGRNIVEIIFKSSWQKRDRPICHVDRILKVHNPPRTVARFEAYRDAVRSRCRATAARAAADGNELLRFHPAPLACALGLAGDTSLCAAAAADPSSSRSSSSPAAAAAGDASSSSSSSSAAASCGVCTAIRHGFAPWVGAHPLGVRTTASSGRAHDCGGSPAAAASNNGGCRAMLVCRVIAGRVRRDGDGDGAAAGEEKEGPFDSVAGEDAASSSVYGNLEELFVANPRAILPCFVVIYRVLES
ncbi:unnamed protein product [Urochloa humidicola]